MKKFLKPLLITLGIGLKSVMLPSTPPKPIPSCTPNIQGTWTGALTVRTTKLSLIFHVRQDETGKLKATIECPEQSSMQIPVDAITLHDHILTFEIASLRASYTGLTNVEETEISGTFSQAGQSFPLIAKRSLTNIVTTLKRPQEPKPPYPYLAEQVMYENKDAGVTLAGTLTLPQSSGLSPAAILIAGSGPNERDENVFGHKMFLVLSDYLTRQGIAVLRFDKRSCGASNGNYEMATSQDFANDVLSGIRYLKSRKEINKQQIELIGHSEGGIIAPLVATTSSDVAFVVLLAGPGVNGEKMLHEQATIINRAMGAKEELITTQNKFQSQIFAIVKAETNVNVAEQKVHATCTEYLDKLPVDLQKDVEAGVSKLLKLFPWFHFFLTYEPVSALKNLKTPVLALFGKRDLQVSPTQNLIPVSQALKAAGNNDFTILQMPRLNHLFQHCETGLPSEYVQIEETMSPEVLKIVADWIIARTVKK